MNLRIASLVIGAFLTAYAAPYAGAEDSAKEGDWKVMFDGKSFDGWTPNESPESFKVENGEIVVHGKRGHLFYTADDKPFKNFEFDAEVKTTPGSNSGIYFHTKPQDSGWPKYGFEAQVCGPKAKDKKKTGSLYGVVDVPTAPPDDEWFKYNIRVEGKHVVISINDKVVVDYTQPEDAKAGKDFTRVVDEGTIALQAHDPASKVFYRNLRIRRLP